MRNIPILKNVFDSGEFFNSINRENLKDSKHPQKFPAESTSKMMENISREENKIKDLNLHDRDKLYIKDIKNSINKLDNISQKLKKI